MTPQQHYQNRGFSDAANAHGLSPVLAELEAIRVRDCKAVNPYVPPVETTPEPYKSAAHAITDLIVTLAPPVVGFVAVGAVVCILVSAAAAVVGAVFAFVSANAFWVGGGALAVAVLAGLFNRGEKQSVGDRNTPPPPNDGGKYEWYQEQRQGWRKM